MIGVDRERKRIGLSIRQLQEDPWVKKVAHLREGQLVEGTITHLTKFGAFARLGEDLEGLIHISELSEQRVAHPKEVIHEGDIVTLRVIKIEPERHRIGLSLRKVDSPAYADLDWKTTLAEVVEETHEDESVSVMRVSYASGPSEVGMAEEAEAEVEALEAAPEEAEVEAEEVVEAQAEEIELVVDETVPDELEPGMEAESEGEEVGLKEEVEEQEDELSDSSGELSKD